MCVCVCVILEIKYRKHHSTLSLSLSFSLSLSLSFSFSLPLFLFLFLFFLLYLSLFFSFFLLLSLTTTTQTFLIPYVRLGLAWLGHHTRLIPTATIAVPSGRVGITQYCLCVRQPLPPSPLALTPPNTVTWRLSCSFHFELSGGAPLGGY